MNLGPGVPKERVRVSDTFYARIGGFLELGKPIGQPFALLGIKYRVLLLEWDLFVNGFAGFVFFAGGEG